MRLEEGCSSNAFDHSACCAVAGWSNPDNRGSATAQQALWSALP
jgi:hypothetical protein